MSDRKEIEEMTNAAVRATMLKRGRLTDHVLALAMAAGAKSVEIRWPGQFEIRTRYEVPKVSRRKRRRLWKLALAELSKPVSE